MNYMQNLLLKYRLNVEFKTNVEFLHFLAKGHFDGVLVLTVEYGNLEATMRSPVMEKKKVKTVRRDETFREPAYLTERFVLKCSLA